uniref:Guanylate cyclase domain-containing protein n=1 Tax=Pyramimonas obovata TaxID=1411642 RepID=A0A7S0QTU0_9CHLO|mmetsp:Transcript_10672/g.22198  ORF Transcript_10672/g.22198 Transcript_10672/m.22198 type:complete len:1420 (+) Transcript_10672:135-4394(+)|eukprot:CAMPEP_0118943122 /NCGR_PEP_ID=MMETSP1169-20130426/37571_1 /TAXON_ID=36882 /ORGANISM="Pyramimonas obovata, Strain CCMP722" /LENGTH=1419 /DNA_ID=CAMNT_0006888291 /DNA_START=70 /DNA_END=4329 /DNA_ORIENTATION=-
MSSDPGEETAHTSPWVGDAAIAIRDELGDETDSKLSRRHARTSLPDGSPTSPGCEDQEAAHVARTTYIDAVGTKHAYSLGLLRYPGILKFKRPFIESSYQASMRDYNANISLLVAVAVGIASVAVNFSTTSSLCGGSVWRCDWRFWIMGHGYFFVAALLCAYLLSGIRSTRSSITASPRLGYSLRFHHQTVLSVLVTASFLCLTMDHYMKELYQPSSMIANECRSSVGLRTEECDSLTFTWWLGAFLDKSMVPWLFSLSGLTFANTLWALVLALFMTITPQFFEVDIEQADGTVATRNHMGGFEVLACVSFLQLVLLMLGHKYRWEELQRWHYQKGFKVFEKMELCIAIAGILLPDRLLRSHLLRDDEEEDTNARGQQTAWPLFAARRERKLRDSLPVRVAPSRDLIAEEYKLVTVMFCSFVKVDVSSLMDPSAFLRSLGEIYAMFDMAVHMMQMYKVEHVMEDYVVASSVIQTGPSFKDVNRGEAFRDATYMVLLARDLMEMVSAPSVSAGSPLQFKVGIHSGPVIGGVAGLSRCFYRLFGDTMNTAARMCQSAPVHRIQLSRSTLDLLPEAMSGLMESQGEIMVKGKGMLQTYLVSEDTALFEEFYPKHNVPRRSIVSELAICSNPRASSLTGLTSAYDSMAVDPPTVPSARDGSFTTDRTNSNITSTIVAPTSVTGARRSSDSSCESSASDDSVKANSCPSPRTLLRGLAKASSLPSHDVRADTAHSAECTPRWFSFPTFEYFRVQQSRLRTNTHADDQRELRTHPTRRSLLHIVNLVKSTHRDEIFTNHAGKAFPVMLSRTPADEMEFEAAEHISKAFESTRSKVQLNWLGATFRDPELEAKFQKRLPKLMQQRALEHLLISLVFQAIFYALTLSHRADKLQTAVHATVGATVFLMHCLGIFVLTNTSASMKRRHALRRIALVINGCHVLQLAGMLILEICVAPKVVEVGLVVVVFLHATAPNAPFRRIAWDGTMMAPMCHYLIVFAPGNRGSAHPIQTNVSISISLVVVACVAHLLSRQSKTQLRTVWLMSHKDKQQTERLERVVVDLVPSSQALQFVLQRQRELVRRNSLFPGNAYRCRDSLGLSWTENEVEDAVVLATDVVGFTTIAEQVGATAVIGMLHDLWCIMDGILEDQRYRSHSYLASSMGYSTDEDDITTFSGSSRHLLVRPRQCAKLNPNSCGEVGGSNSQSWWQKRSSILNRGKNFGTQSNHTQTRLEAPYKMDTVGDAYIVVQAIPANSSLACRRKALHNMFKVTLAIQQSVEEYSALGLHGLEPGQIKIRLGMCIGSIIAGVMGLLKPRYHVYGAALRTAQQLESKSLPGHMRVDQQILDQLQSVPKVPQEAFNPHDPFLIDLTKAAQFSCLTSTLNMPTQAAVSLASLNVMLSKSDDEDDEDDTCHDGTNGVPLSEPGVGS